MVEKNVVEISRNYIYLLKERNFPVIKAFLYGSYAKGNYRKDSDIDIAVFLSNLTDPVQAQIEMLKLTWKFDTRIEPHPFHEEEIGLNNPIVKEILSTGIQISI